MKTQLTKSQQDEIAKRYGTVKAQSLADEYGCTIHQVYEVGRRYSVQQKQNTKVTITPKMHQIILGGVLGDGRLKRNGLHNVYYSECHALGESGYLRWKHENLGELTERSAIYGKNMNDNRYSPAEEFTTLTTPSLVPYKDITRVEAIQQLDELGLLIHLLDDGWFAYSNPERTRGRFCLTTYMWSVEERQALIDQWHKVTGVKFTNHGIKRVNTGASNKENDKITELVLKYFPADIDVVKKKFRTLIPNV